MRFIISPSRDPYRIRMLAKVCPVIDVQKARRSLGHPMTEIIAASERKVSRVGAKAKKMTDAE